MNKIGTIGLDLATASAALAPCSSRDARRGRASSTVSGRSVETVEGLEAGIELEGHAYGR